MELRPALICLPFQQFSISTSGPAWHMKGTQTWYRHKLFLQRAALMGQPGTLKPIHSL